LHLYLSLANIEILFDAQKTQDKYCDKNGGDGNFDVEG
jgi:hypothetical protein